MTEYLLEFDAHTGSGVETIRVATRTYTTGPLDTPANAIYAGAMMNAGELKLQMMENGGTGGAPGTNVGHFEVTNTDGSRTGWLQYGVGGRAFRLYTISSVKSAFSTRVLIFTGTVRGFASADFRKSIIIRIRDKLEELDRPVLADSSGPLVYGGTTTSSGSANKRDGDASLKDVPKAKGYGFVYKIAPPLVNPFYLIYECGSTITGTIVGDVADGGVALTYDGAEADITDLIAATIAGGHYRTSGGLLRLGADPAKKLTCGYLAVSSYTTSSLYEPGPLAKSILLDCGVSSGDLDHDSFDELVSGAFGGPYGCGIYVNSLTQTVLETVSQVLGSVGAAITATADGKYKVAVLNTKPLPEDATAAALITLPPEVAVDTFTIRDINEANSDFQIFASKTGEGDGVPAYSVNIKWRPYEVLLSKGEIAASLLTGGKDGFIDDLGQPFRSEPATDTAIKTKHPLAQTLEFETRLMRENEGPQAEGVRRLKLYGEVRNFFSFSVTMDRFVANATINMGDVVAIDMAHFGFSPKYLYVVGIHMKFGERLVTLTLFG